MLLLLTLLLLLPLPRPLTGMAGWMDG